jgi:hypothetical protein
MMLRAGEPPANESYRELWAATIPFAGLAVLAHVGAILSVLFRLSPPSSSGTPWLGLSYLLVMLPVPVLLSCFLIGYARARVILLVLLWGSLALTTVNLFGVLEVKRKAAVGLLPFLLTQALALRLGHGTRLRDAALVLEARRQARWGPGFGWMLVITAAGLFSCASLAVLGAVEIQRAGGPDLLHLPGILRLMPVGIGIGVAAFGSSRIARSRAPMAWIAGVSLVLLACIVALNGWASSAGSFALFAMVLDALVLLGLTRPTLSAFCERQRNKRGMS